MAIKVRNWKKHQHFKNRRPPWIKLYREILDQRDIMMISDCSFRVLIGLWLLASEDETKEGILPSIDEISFRLRKDKSIITKCLKELENFLYYDDITMISEGYQDGSPETETETETEKRQRQRQTRTRYGEYHHVLLTNEQHKKLETEWGLPELNRMIQVLDEGIQQKGYKYTDHYLTLKKWRKRDLENSNQSKSKIEEYFS